MSYSKGYLNIPLRNDLLKGINSTFNSVIQFDKFYKSNSPIFYLQIKLNHPMKKLIYFFLLSVFVFISNAAHSQITVSGSTGADGNYTSLTGVTGAFNTLNSIDQEGYYIVITVTVDALSETGAIALNSNGWHSLIIKPGAGVTAIISGANDSALISLNGADSVTFDGSNNGTSSKDMTIRNTGDGSVIRLINGASQDTVRSCIVEGQTSSYILGTIFFSTSKGLSGNSNNVINGCDVRDRSDAVGLPTIAIYSNGSTGFENAGNKVTFCNVFNFTNTGVLVDYGGPGDGWVINSNNFYQTSSGSTFLKFISIKGGSGHIVNSNFIGGSSPNAAGNFFATSEPFYGIDLDLGNSSLTTIENNTVRNIRSSSLAVYFGCTGINFNSGLATIIGNTIGSSDTAQRLDVNSSSFGILNRSYEENIVISNNVVNNFHMVDATPYGSVYCFYMESTNSGSLTLTDNTVMNVTNASTPDPNFFFGGPTQTFGYFIFISGVNTIRGNTVTNMGNINTGPNIGFPNNITGMTIIKSQTGSIVENNRISGLYGSSPTVGTRADNVTGFTNELSANATFQNNVISIDGGSNSDRILRGIYEKSGDSTSVMNYYYNSVNIYGTSTGNNNTYAFIRSDFYETTVDIKNNVFSNSRVAASGSNIALANENNSSIGWSSTASNYNALFSLNNATMTQWGATVSDLSGFQSVSGGDVFTLVGNPGFTSNTNLLPDGTNANCWTLKGNGIAISSIGADINGNPRSTSVANGGTDIGAYEFAVSVQPPVYTNATASTGVYKFIHQQDTMATVNVTTLGTLADLNAQYFSGENPPGLPHSSVLSGFGNVYWNIYPTNSANSGYTYNVTLHYSPALIGSIANESMIKVAKNNGNDTIYVPFNVPGTNPGEYQLDVVNHNITVYGLTGFSRFILTDGDSPLPVELSSFTSSISGRDVKLHWTTASETNNSGFQIERSAGNNQWSAVSFVNGSGTSTSQKDYSYTDKNLSSGKYNYRLKQVDYNGQYNYFNLNNEVNIGLPSKFDLSQNYPNPFNPSTKISFDIPVDGKVSITLYDISGKEVSKLVNEFKTAGYYSVSFNGSNLSSGTYFYRIVSEGNGQNFVATKKMTLLK